ncbi:24998_t:CDS:1, partial [Cetraspora pellucida]
EIVVFRFLDYVVRSAPQTNHDRPVNHIKSATVSINYSLQALVSWLFCMQE